MWSQSQLNISREGNKRRRNLSKALGNSKGQATKSSPNKDLSPATRRSIELRAYSKLEKATNSSEIMKI